jgi:hypothetical protein
MGRRPGGALAMGAVQANTRWIVPLKLMRSAGTDFFREASHIRLRIRL